MNSTIDPRNHGPTGRLFRTPSNRSRSIHKRKHIFGRTIPILTPCLVLTGKGRFCLGSVMLSLQCLLDQRSTLLRSRHAWPLRSPHLAVGGKVSLFPLFTLTPDRR